MKIQSLLNSLKLKVLILSLAIALSAVFVLARTRNNEVQIVYHQSIWNEYILEIERAIRSGESSDPLNIKHVYGGVVPHHIPTTIPKLVEFYNRIKQNQFVKKIIIIGPDHVDGGVEPVTVSNVSFFTGFGELKPIKNLATELQNDKLANVEESPFDSEHSVGSQILVISKIFPNAQVTPIILRSDTTKSHAEALGRKLATVIDEETLLIASVDFSHYLSTDQAFPIDEISGNVIQNLDLESLSLVKADSSRSMLVFVEAMNGKRAIKTDNITILNTNNLMQNSDYTTGYVFGYWGL